MLLITQILILILEIEAFVLIRVIKGTNRANNSSPNTQIIG